MICIRMTEREDGVELSARGHAGAAPRGQDVVCAGVSTLVYAFVAYLETLSPIATVEDGDGGRPHLEVREGDGFLEVKTFGMGGRDRDALAVICEGLGLIASRYPAHVMLDTHTHRKGDEHESN